MTEARHLSEHQISASLMPGAARPVCPVAGCTRCAAALDEAHGAARTFHDQILPRTLPAIRARLERRAPWWRARWWMTGPLAVVAAAAVLVAVWPRAPASLGQAERGDPVLIAKGGASSDDVRVFVKRDGAVHRLAGDVHPGDALQLVVEPRGARYVLVVSLDAAHQLTVYAPFGGSASAPLAASALPVALPDSIELDATLGDEEVWVVLSDAPVGVAQARSLFGHADPAGAVVELPGLPGARAIRVMLHKTAR